jgi:hypothetical protein
MTIAFTFILALLFSPNEQPDCRSLQIGKFRTINYAEDSTQLITYIERTENFQIEKSKDFGVEYKFKIDWISDCSYTLTWIETITDEYYYGYPPDQILTVEITNISADYYNIVGRSNLFEQKIEGKVEILE